MIAASNRTRGFLVLGEHWRGVGASYEVWESTVARAVDPLTPEPEDDLVPEDLSMGGVESEALAATDSAYEDGEPVPGPYEPFTEGDVFTEYSDRGGSLDGSESEGNYPAADDPLLG